VETARAEIHAARRCEVSKLTGYSVVERLVYIVDRHAKQPGVFRLSWSQTRLQRFRLAERPSAKWRSFCFPQSPEPGFPRISSPRFAVYRVPAWPNLACLPLTYSAGAHYFRREKHIRVHVGLLKCGKSSQRGIEF